MYISPTTDYTVKNIYSHVAPVIGIYNKNDHLSPYYYKIKELIKVEKTMF
jgi:hypothetical protein